VNTNIKFSTIVSYVSHPIFIPFIGIWAILNFHWVSSSRFTDTFLNSILFLVLLTTVFIPIFALGSIFQKYRPSDFKVFGRKERSYAVWILAAVYLALLWMIPLLYEDKMIRIFFIAMALSSAIAGVINLRYKISFHTLGWAGFLVLTIALNQQSFSDLFLIILGAILWIGLVAYARIVEEAHDRGQVYAGFGLGIVVNAITFIISYGI
jgi:hypothetical protein